VPGDAETPVPEDLHEPGEVTCHCPLRVGRVIGGIGTAVPDAQHRLADVDALQRETLEDEGLGTSDADQ
jgi:hypothetical protein